MLHVVPGAHVMFGNGPTAAVHNQMYDFNDEAIPYAVALLAAITEEAAESHAGMTGRARLRHRGMLRP